MEKTPFENEESSPVEPNNLEASHHVTVNTNEIDTLSLPQKKALSSSDDDLPVDDNSVSEDSVDEDWLLLSQDWQSQPFEKTDIQALLKRTKKRILYTKLLLAINVIASLCVCIALIVGLYQGDWGTPTIAYLAFGCVGSITFVYYEIKIRLRIWQQCCDSPDKAVTNAIAGVESSIKYHKLTKLSFWVLMPVVNWYLYVMYQESDKALWPPLLVINIIIVISWGVSHWLHVKRAKELVKLNAI